MTHKILSCCSREYLFLWKTLIFPSRPSENTTSSVESSMTRQATASPCLISTPKPMYCVLCQTASSCTSPQVFLTIGTQVFMCALTFPYLFPQYVYKLPECGGCLVAHSMLGIWKALQFAEWMDGWMNEQAHKCKPFAALFHWYPGEQLAQHWHLVKVD